LHASLADLREHRKFFLKSDSNSTVLADKSSKLTSVQIQERIGGCDERDNAIPMHSHEAESHSIISTEHYSNGTIVDFHRSNNTTDHNLAPLANTTASYYYAVVAIYGGGSRQTVKCFKSLKAAQLHAASVEFMQLKPVAYHMKKDVESKALRFGFIAQDMAELYPDFVSSASPQHNYDSDGNWIGGTEIKDIRQQLGIHYDDVIALLTMMVKHSIEQLDGVDSRLDRVAGKIVTEQGARVHKQVRKLASLREEIDKLKQLEAQELHTIAERVTHTLKKPQPKPLEGVQPKKKSTSHSKKGEAKARKQREKKDPK